MTVASLRPGLIASAGLAGRIAKLTAQDSAGLPQTADGATA